MLRRRSASAWRDPRIRPCSSAVSDPSPSSYRQILKRLTAERRDSLLCESRSAVRWDRRSIQLQLLQKHVQVSVAKYRQKNGDLLQQRVSRTALLQAICEKRAI